jgi:hypothetical protein
LSCGTQISSEVRKLRSIARRSWVQTCWQDLPPARLSFQPPTSCDRGNSKMARMPLTEAKGNDALAAIAP